MESIAETPSRQIDEHINNFLRDWQLVGTKGRSFVSDLEFQDILNAFVPLP